MNLYEFIKSNDFRGFSLRLIRRFTKQLLSSLVLLKGHRVIHCDLKPENVLLAAPNKGEIKVIDFGSSCFEHEKGMLYNPAISCEPLTIASLHIHSITVLPVTGGYPGDDLWSPY